MRWLVVVAIGARLAAVAVLVAGPWADSPSELAGWDVDRFQQMADAPGRHWVDSPVEYPPGSVIVIEALSAAGGDREADAGAGVVATHRLLAVSSLLVDLGVAGVLAHWWHRRAGAAYLLVGLPLVPMGLVRLDLWAVLLAVVAAAALLRRRRLLFAAAATAAAMVKVWPLLLIPAALATGRRREAISGVAVMATAGLAWLAYGGWSLEPINQVLSLRGASGWHVESIGGSLTVLGTGDSAVRQLNAFRIGTLDPRLVLAGRVVTIAVTVALAALGHRALRTSRRAADAVVATVMLGATAALIVTAPLLSPQFVLWLTPWAAILAVPPEGTSAAPLPPPLRHTAGAAALTGAILVIFGPAALDRTAPALLLLGRDALLIAVVVSSLRSLAGRGDEWSGRPEDPLGHGRPGPGPAGAEPGIDQMTEEPGALPC